MYSLKDREDIILQALPDDFFDADREIFTVGRKIKERLGEDGYLLDNYLSMLLKALNGNTIQYIVEGSEYVFSDAYDICRQIEEGRDAFDERLKEDRLYPELKKHMEIYSKKYKSPITVTELAVIAVAPIIMKQEYSGALISFASRGWIDSVRLREIYDSIVTLAGSRLMDRLLELVRQRFLITPAVNVCMQAVTNHYLDALLERDEVSSKQLFQLLLDDNPVEDTDEAEDEKES